MPYDEEWERTASDKQAAVDKTVVEKETQGVIPWTVLVRHAPAILAAADSLLARARPGKAEAATPTPDGAERLRKLERSAEESAQLLHDIAQQVYALTAMQEKSAKRVRGAVALGIAAAALAAGAWLFVLLS